MTDLSTLFNNLGPAGGSILAGVQLGNEANRNQQEQAMNQAKMDALIQETRQAEAMNPLLIQAKQQAIDAAAMEARQKKDEYRDEILGKAIPELEKVAPLQRHARMEQIFSQAGMPLDQADRQHLFSLSPDDLVKEMRAKHEWAITQSSKYRTEMDKQRLHNKGLLDVEGARQAAKEKAAKEKGAAEATLQQDLSKAKTFQAQAVVYGNHAAKARLKGDTEEANRLDLLAKQATAQDLSARAASGDAAAARQLELLRGLGVDVQTPSGGAAPAGRRPISEY